VKDPIKYVLLLLKYRLRSESEIRTRMRVKGFNEEEIQKALEFLRSEGLLDEKLLAEGLRDKYLYRGVSPRKIKQILRKTGIRSEIVESAMLGQELPEEEALRIVEKITHGEKILDRKVFQRVFNKLQYMGYSASEIFDLLKRNGIKLKLPDFREE